MVVTESRERVLEYAEAFRNIAKADNRTLKVYGAFSGTLRHSEATVDEAEWHRSSC